MPRKDGSDRPKEARFREVVRELIAQGISPTPTYMAKMYPDDKFADAGTRTFSDGLSTIRIQEYERAGWRKMPGGGVWYPPVAA